MPIQNRHWTKALAKLAKEAKQKQERQEQQATPKVPAAHIQEPKRRFVQSRVVNRLGLPAPTDV